MNKNHLLSSAFILVFALNDNPQKDNLPYPKDSFILRLPPKGYMQTSNLRDNDVYSAEEMNNSIGSV